MGAGANTGPTGRAYRPQPAPIARDDRQGLCDQFVNNFFPITG
jgi:hypothetical protein